MIPRIKINAGRVSNYLEKVEKGYNKEMLNAVDDIGKGLTDYVKRRYFSGPYSKSAGKRSVPLGVRTGKLRNSIRPLKVTRGGSKNVITGGISIGNASTSDYLNVNVQDKPTVTVIKPKKRKYLTIPLKKALNSKGVVKIKPRNVPNSIIKKTRKGGLLLGSKSGNRFIPYFILKKSVSIPSRVHIPEILDKYRLVVYNKINRAVDKAHN